jgi:outer membrane lipoprotein SlyB
MAIFNPMQAGVGQASPVFEALSSKLQDYQEQRQIEREQNALSKLRNQGLLGVSKDTLIDPNTNKLNLTGESMTVSEHYKALSNELGGNKQLKKVFGRTATADDIKDFIKGEQDKRDQKIGEAILNRMEEIGSTDIYDVIDKDDKNFESWYNTTSKEIKKELRDVHGYQPGQKEIAFLPDFLEKAIARGDIGEGTAQTLMAGAGVGGLYGARAGREALTKRGQASYREFLKEQEGYKDVAGRRRNIANQQAELSKERADLKKRLKEAKGRNKTAIQKRISDIDKQKAKLRSQGSKAKKGRAEDIKTESRKAREEFKDTRKKGRLSKAKGLGTGLLAGLGGSAVGGALGEAVGGETGRSVGALGGTFAPELVKKYGPSVLKRLAPQLLRGAGAGLTKTGIGAKPGLALLGVGTALDYLLND